jgi:hypothetical protein
MESKRAYEDKKIWDEDGGKKVLMAAILTQPMVVGDLKGRRLWLII